MRPHDLRAGVALLLAFWRKIRSDSLRIFKLAKARPNRSPIWDRQRLFFALACNLLNERAESRPLRLGDKGCQGRFYDTLALGIESLCALRAPNGARRRRSDGAAGAKRLHHTIRRRAGDAQIFLQLVDDRPRRRAIYMGQKAAQRVFPPALQREILPVFSTIHGVVYILFILVIFCHFNGGRMPDGAILGVSDLGSDEGQPEARPSFLS